MIEGMSWGLLGRGRVKGGDDVMCLCIMGGCSVFVLDTHDELYCCT